MDIIIKIIQFFLCFTILVGIHELGHFLMARVFKIRVDKFYIFFDPWYAGLLPLGALTAGAALLLLLAMFLVKRRIRRGQEERYV